MNPLVFKAVEKINWNKVMAAAAGLIVIIAVAIIIKKHRKKSKTEAANEAYLKTLTGNINISNLSYDYPSWYESKAISLASALDASFGNNGGLFGCDQKSVYEIMKQLKTSDDAEQLELSFGTRELNASWLKKKKAMTLPQAIQELMTTKEHKKVNEILKEKGIEYSF